MDEAFAKLFIEYLNEILHFTHTQIVLKRLVSQAHLFVFEPLPTLNFENIDNDLEKWLKLYEHKFVDFLMKKKRAVVSRKSLLDMKFAKGIEEYRQNAMECTLNCQQYLAEQDYKARFRLERRNRALALRNQELDMWAEQARTEYNNLTNMLNVIDSCIQLAGNVRVDITYNHNPQNKLFTINLS